jgi:hypothetical protein
VTNVPPTRSGLIETGDRLVARARSMAGNANSGGEFNFGSKARWDYWCDLYCACYCYESAGLRLLAGRVRWLARQSDPGAAWVKFDRLNAGGCGVA